MAPIRNRPPSLASIDVLRLAGTSIGQIEVQSDGYRLDLAKHPSGEAWGLFAEMSISDESKSEVFIVHLVGTFDVGTGKWKRATNDEVLDYLALMHHQTLWTFGAGLIRQLAAICEVEVEVPALSPEPAIVALPEQAVSGDVQH